MTQTRFQSFVESCLNILIGYLVSLASQIIIFPWFGIDIPLSSNLWIGVWFTVISLVRSFLIRRWFNAMKKYPVDNPPGKYDHGR